MANFPSPRANVVEGDNGVSIEVLGRTGIRYSEPGRSCLVDSEVLATPAVAVWPSGIRGWDPPHADAPLTDDDRRRILQSIADAFASQGWGLEVIDPPTDDDRRRILQEIADAVPTQEWSVEDHRSPRLRLGAIGGHRCQRRCGRFDLAGVCTEP